MRNSLFITMLLTLCPAPLMQAEIGCMDNSYHLAQGYDPKTYHYVRCNCPCSRHTQSENRLQCSKCKHFRYPKPAIVIQTNREQGAVIATKKVACKQSCTPGNRLSWRTR